MNDTTRFLNDIMKVVESLCKEKGIEYLVQFQMDKGKGLVYQYQSDDIILTGDTIMNQYEKFKIRNK